AEEDHRDVRAAEPLTGAIGDHALPFQDYVVLNVHDVRAIEHALHRHFAPANGRRGLVRGRLTGELRPTLALALLVGRGGVALQVSEAHVVVAVALVVDRHAPGELLPPTAAGIVRAAFRIQDVGHQQVGDAHHAVGPGAELGEAPRRLFGGDARQVEVQ